MQFEFKDLRHKSSDIRAISQRLSEISWQPIHFNRSTSATLQRTLFFGRSIYLPINTKSISSRVIVISGCKNKQQTNQVSSQVQEWSLDDLTVRFLPDLTPGRTSFNCLHKTKDRYIYVIGGNTSNNQTLKLVSRLDIYSKQWHQLPDLNESRANCSSFIPQGSSQLYVFGGFNLSQTDYNNQSQITTMNAEVLDLSKGDKMRWQILSANLNCNVKACNFIHQISPNELLMFGGWYKGKI